MFFGGGTPSKLNVSLLCSFSFGAREVLGKGGKGGVLRVLKMFETGEACFMFFLKQMCV